PEREAGLALAPDAGDLVAHASGQPAAAGCRAGPGHAVPCPGRVRLPVRSPARRAGRRPRPGRTADRRCHGAPARAWFPRAPRRRGAPDDAPGGGMTAVHGFEVERGHDASVRSRGPERGHDASVRSRGPEGAQEASVRLRGPASGYDTRVGSRVAASSWGSRPRTAAEVTTPRQPLPGAPPEAPRRCIHAPCGIVEGWIDGEVLRATGIR